MDDDTLDPATAVELAYTSPQLFIQTPTLIRCPDSPTGWLLVTPGPPPETPVDSLTAAPNPTTRPILSVPGGCH